MELSFETRPVRYLGHILHETGRQEETAEVIVPDSCPDVERVVFASASALLRGTECRAGSVLISGGIRASALCVPEDGTSPQKLDAYLPFSLRMEHTAIAERAQIFPELFVRQADARLVNSRKILFRVDLGCTLDGYEQKELTVYTLQSPPQQLQLRTQTYPVLLPTETSEKSFTLSDELELPSGRAQPTEILSYETRPEVTDCKVVGSKAVFKGNLCLHVLYRNAEGGLGVWERQLPFSQFCDLTGDYEQAQMDAQVVVTSAELELDASDAHRLLLSVGMTAQCVVSDTLTLTLTEDAYAVGAVLEPEWTQYDLECRLDRQTLRDAVRQQIGGEIAGVVDTAVYLDAPYLERDGGAMRVKAPMTLRVLYQDASGALQGTAAKSEAAVETALCVGVCLREQRAGGCGWRGGADGGHVPPVMQRCAAASDAQRRHARALHRARSGAALRRPARTARQGERLGDRQAVRHDGAGCEGGESSGLRACGGGAAPADPDVRCKMVRPDFGQAARFSGKGKA